jgi:hypothetical protein
LERNRLETEAEIAARDPAVALEHRRDALDRARWNDEHPPTWSEHRHANRLAGHIEREAAFGALPQAQIKLGASVDLAAAHGFPGPGGAGHHTKRGGRRTIFGAPIASMPAETADVPSKTGWRPVRSTRRIATSGYAAGLRASEVGGLMVIDVDSARASSWSGTATGRRIAT